MKATSPIVDVQPPALNEPVVVARELPAAAPARRRAGRYGAKVHSLGELAARLDAIRPGKTIAHCHGVFDLLHIGHIRHLEQARQLGDVLVVTVTPDRYVNKGPNRPAFGEQLRAEALAALDCVDFVAINEDPMADRAIVRLRPNLYIKGPDYKDAAKDRTHGITVEEQAIRSVGGRLVITEDITFSSSNLINQHLDLLSDEAHAFLAAFRQQFSADQVLDLLDAIRPLRILVVGETIIDEYQYCEAIGKSSKEPTLAVKAGQVERFAGGVLAVANHLANFCDNVSLLTVLGEQSPADDGNAQFVRQHLNPAVDATFIRRPEAPTIVKRRYIDGYFFQKLFEVYQINDLPMTGQPQDELCDALTASAGEYDLVLTLDFGHGMLGPRAINIMCDRAPFLAVNAQSNAGNFGYHTICKYPRADFICVAEKEIRLEARDRGGELQPILRSVADKLDCQRAVVTRGSHGCLCYWGDDGFSTAPAIAGQVRDRMGAGDTFLSVAAPLVTLSAPAPIVALAGNAAGAQAVTTVGHRQPVDKTALIRHIQCLLK